MNICVILLFMVSITLTHAEDIEDKSSEVNLKKRNLEELSYSFAATDIGSKSGTHIKTITVIKNKKHRSLKINQELHKNEDWGSEFRNNFDKYGKIPDFPQVFNKNENVESIQEVSSEKSPKMILFQKESIPIYEELDEEPQPTSSTPALQTSIRMPAVMTQQISTKGQYTTNKAEQNNNSSQPQEIYQKEYIQRLPMYHYLRSLKPLLSNNYQFPSEQTKDPNNKESQLVKESYTNIDANAQSIYTTLPGVIYSVHQQMSTTTVSNPYTAPSKKSQSLNNLRNPQTRSTPSDIDTTTQSTIKKIVNTNQPETSKADSRSTRKAANNQYHRRFRGLRY